MLMRMEQHLRTEEEARKNFERQLDTSLQSEVRLRKELESVYRLQKDRKNELTQQKLDAESVSSLLHSHRN